MRECCRQVEAGVISNSRNKIHQTWYINFSRSLYSLPSPVVPSMTFFILNSVEVVSWRTRGKLSSPFFGIKPHIRTVQRRRATAIRLCYCRPDRTLPHRLSRGPAAPRPGALKILGPLWRDGLLAYAWLYSSLVRRPARLRAYHAR